MDAYKAVVTKRDTRSFSGDSVSEESLHRILQAGRMAGSAKNLQPCRFVVLTEQSRKEALAACGSFAAWIPSAPVNIAVVIPADGREFDAGRAAQNMMVVAHSEGLASCPVTMHDQECALKALGLPDGFRVSIVLAIGPPGPPAPRPTAARAPLEDVVHKESWRA
jgi:nitroreductase